MSLKDKSNKYLLPWIDYIKGIGILLVVLGHTSNMDTIWHSWIYTFHMALFFFISGFLYKQNRSIVHIAKRLLLPLFIYMLFIVIPIEINQLISDSTSVLNIIWRFFNVYTCGEATAFWFPYSLFIGLVVFDYLNSKFKDHFVMLSLIFLVIAYLLDFIDIAQKFYPFAINRLFFIIPFLYLGYIYKMHESFFDKKIITLFFAIFTIIGFILSEYNIVDIKNGYFGLPIWSFIGAGATILFLIRIIKNIDYHFRIVVLRRIGEASLTIMYLHIIINKMIIYYIGYHSFNFIINTAVCCVIHFIFKKNRITRLLLLGTK